MKILILSNVGGGLYRFRKELISTLHTRGDTVVATFPADGFEEKITSLGCEYIPISMNRRGMNPMADIGLFFSYVKLLQQQKPDVVITYTIKPNVYGGMACQFTRIPYISNITGLGTSIQNAGVLRYITMTLYKLGLHGARCTFFQNNENCKIMERDGGISGYHRLIPGSGVNLEENCYHSYPEETEGIRFLAVGRIMRDKGTEELLACASAIHKKYPNTKFLLAGSYDDPAYEEKINRGVMEGYLDYLGHRSDIHDLMAQSHCIIHPSYHEGLSNVLLEGAACGRPVIASRVPGCQETFDEGVSGLGVEAKNGDSLIAAVEQFLSLSQEAHAEMGRRGRGKIEGQFDRQLVVDAYLEEIDRIYGE